MFDKLSEWNHFVSNTKTSKLFNIKLGALYSVLLDVCIESNSTTISCTEQFLSEQTKISRKSVKKWLDKLIDTKVVSIVENRFGKGVHQFIVLKPTDIE